MLVRALMSRVVWAPEGGEGAAAPADPAPAAAPAATPEPPAATPEPVAALAGTLLSPEPKPAEPKPAEPKPAEPEPVPLDPKDYKIDLPAGFEADDALLQVFLSGAAKGGMDNESVNAVIAELGPKLAERLAAPQQEWVSLNQRWSAEVSAMPDIGGTNLDATVATVQSAIDLVSTSYVDATGKQVTAAEQALAVRQALTLTGAGNNPAIVRLLHDLSKSHVERGHVQGQNPVAASPSRASLLYPSAAKSG